MIRKVIEYLRKKNKITVEDLVVEICSGNMYYKYIAGTKNMSAKNLKLIKERLGADDLTKEEVDEYKKDLNKITLKIMRYYSSKKELEKDVEPLIELENQLILNEDLFIDYIIVKMNYLFIINDMDNVGDLLSLLNQYYTEMNVLNKLMYQKINTFYKKYMMQSIKEETDEMEQLLNNNLYNQNYGCFYITHALNYIKIKERAKALKATEVAIELFQRDMNLVGQVKASNIRIMLLMENRKYEEAIKLLLTTYENSKLYNITNEMFVCLPNIVCCYLGLGNKEMASKYWNIFLKNISKIQDEENVKYYLNNNSISMLTNFDYYQMEKELCEFISLLEKYKPIDNIALNNLMVYFSIESEDERTEFIEKTLLSSLLGKAHFSYCKWLLDTCVNYYLDRRMYKKASNFETVFMEEFRKYYFN